MKIFLITLVSFFVLPVHAKLVRYEIVVTKNQVNLSGKKNVDFALMVNNQIPAPVLEFTEGDEAEIVVKNQIPKEELSIHWHGILLPPEMDGVPYVTTPPIYSGEQFTFKFKLRQHGTYWYHSHTNVQEQKGVYGAFIVHPKNKTIKADKDLVLVLSDWSDEDALNILSNLRKDGDYYLYKKGTMRSWLGAIQAGELKSFLHNEWIGMGGMDYSDVGYDAFLINGKRDAQLLNAKKGEKIRLRIINAAASTYFHVALGSEEMQVVSADGVDVEPVRANEILMGMAETYDVLFKVPENKNYEFKITAQDGTGSASGWIGSGAEKVEAPKKPMPSLYGSMDHSAHADHADHADHTQHSDEYVDHVSAIQTLTVDDLSAQKPTVFKKDKKTYDVKLVLGGDMERYVWHLNGKSIHEDRNIIINEGDVVRFTFENQTMMHHPMHLHGHFFRVLNKNGDYSPLKHTVDVGPHSTRTIEFLADEPGEWMLHCHNLYHLKTGMARVVKYMSYKPKKEIEHFQKHDPHLHDHWYFYGRLEGATNRGTAYFRLSQTWNQLDIKGEAKKHDNEWEFEGDAAYRRWLGLGINIFAGAEAFDRNYSAVLGAGYTLPFLIESQFYVNHSGKLRIALEKRFQWTRNIFTFVDLKWRTEHPREVDLAASLMFQNNWSWAAGLMLTNNSLGVGALVQF